MRNENIRYSLICISEISDKILDVVSSLNNAIYVVPDYIGEVLTLLKHDPNRKIDELFNHDQRFDERDKEALNQLSSVVGRWLLTTLRNMGVELHEVDDVAFVELTEQYLYEYVLLRIRV